MESDLSSAESSSSNEWIDPESLRQNLENTENLAAIPSFKSLKKTGMAEDLQDSVRKLYKKKKILTKEERRVQKNIVSLKELYLGEKVKEDEEIANVKYEKA